MEEKNIEINSTYFVNVESCYVSMTIERWKKRIEKKKSNQQLKWFFMMELCIYTNHREHSTVRGSFFFQTRKKN